MPRSLRAEAEADGRFRALLSERRVEPVARTRRRVAQRAAPPQRGGRERAHRSLTTTRRTAGALRAHRRPWAPLTSPSMLFGGRSGAKAREEHLPRVGTAGLRWRR